MPSDRRGRYHWVMSSVCIHSVFGHEMDSWTPGLPSWRQLRAHYDLTLRRLGSLHTDGGQQRLFHPCVISLSKTGYPVWTCSLFKKRRLRGNIIKCFKILNGFTKVGKCKLFMINANSGTRNNGTTLKCKLITSGCTKLFFTLVVRNSTIDTY